MDSSKTIQLKDQPLQKLTLEVFSEESLIFQFQSYHYEARAFDGGDTYHFKVLAMRSRDHGLLTPVWEEDWTEIVPGISTRKFGILLQRMAGPVSIQFERTRYMRFWNRRTYEDERSTHVNEFWWHCRHESIADDTDLTKLGC